MGSHEASAFAATFKDDDGEHTRFVITFDRGPGVCFVRIDSLNRRVTEDEARAIFAKAAFRFRETY